MHERYLRQTMIDKIGADGQAKLSRASAIVVGAGGLGSPALTYLAAAGIWRLGLIDSDTVTLSNLNRQFLYSSDDIGRSKAISAKERLLAINNEIEVHASEEFLCDDNAAALLSGYDVVIGAVDSFETRFVINRACVTLSIPYIDGGINGFGGCVTFVHPPHTPCLSCVFPEKRTKKDSPGVLGATAGVIGTIEANIALLLLLDLPNPLENKLLMYDGLRLSMDLIDIKCNENCLVCGVI